MHPVTQMGCRAERERNHSLPIPSPSKCTHCALVFDQLLEVWGLELALSTGAFSAAGAETRPGRAGWGVTHRFAVVVV